MYRIDYYWHETVADDRFRYAVIAARHAGQWLFVRQKTRDSYELRRSWRESGESIEGTARRELYETGAVQFTLKAICAFAVSQADQDTDPEGDCGMLYLAEVTNGKIFRLSPKSVKSGRGRSCPNRSITQEVQHKLFALAQTWSDYCIRPVMAADAAAITAGSTAWALATTIPKDKTAGKLKAILADRRDGLFVAEHRTSGAVIGYIHWHPTSAPMPTA